MRKNEQQKPENGYNIRCLFLISSIVSSYFLSLTHLQMSAQGYGQYVILAVAVSKCLCQTFSSDSSFVVMLYLKETLEEQNDLSVK